MAPERGIDGFLKVERAIEFSRKVVVQEIVDLHPDDKESWEKSIGWRERKLKAGTLAVFMIDLPATHLADHFSLNTARALGGGGVPFGTVDPAPRYSNSHAGPQLPVDLLSMILDHLQGETDTLRSLAPCNKTFHSLAQPRLYNEVKLHTHAGLLRFAYALALQPKSSWTPLRVEKLELHWSYLRTPYESKDDCQPAIDRLNHLVLEMCPSITDLTVMWSSATMVQSDVDALDSFPRLITYLQSLTLDIRHLLHDDQMFGAEGHSIMPNHKPKLIYRKGTIDRWRQLRSLKLTNESPGVGSTWSVLEHTLGPALRRLKIHFRDYAAFSPDHLHQIAKSCPQLEVFVLKGPCRASYADVSRFIELMGSSLTQLELPSVIAPKPAEGSVSLVFEALMLYAKGIEVLRFGDHRPEKINRDDLQVLANPDCMPRLRELAIGGFDWDWTPTDEAQYDEDGEEPHACELAIYAVLRSHKSTLNSIELKGPFGMLEYGQLDIV